MPVLLFLPAYLSLPWHTTDSSKSLKAWEDNSILKQGFPEHSAFFLAKWCIIHTFWDHKFRILNSNIKFYKKNRTCYPAFQFTVLYVVLAKRMSLSSKERQKFLSFIIKLVSAYISAALYCSEYQRHYRFLFLKSGTKI